MIVKLKWITPDADEMIAELARVSNPNGPRKRSNAELIGYLIAEKHWSPFEMANICAEIRTTRDIGRQILRHRSMCFQEFSQRYADPDDLGQPIMREPRLQHPTNRQASVPLDDLAIEHNWYARQRELWNHARETYEWARENGFAKEVARAGLPEGLTPTRLYANATIRSALHFLDVRLDMSAQKEIRIVAEDILQIMETKMPATTSAWVDCRKAAA